MNRNAGQGRWWLAAAALVIAWVAALLMFGT